MANTRLRDLLCKMLRKKEMPTYKRPKINVLTSTRRYMKKLTETLISAYFSILLID